MIRVKVVAPFQVKSANPAGEVELPDRTTLAGLLRRTDAPLLAFTLPVMVNGRQVSKWHRLRDGDLIVFILPISGG